MTFHSARRPFVTPFVVALLATTALVAQTAQDNAADAERLIKALDMQPGSIVGEIGAGSGELTLAIARAVGPTGRVLSNELNKERLEQVRRRAADAGLQHVTAIEGKEKETNFPDECCDSIFMRNVYHHVGDPASMNASLFKSLKPGGRVAVIDFGPPPGAESEDPAGRDDDGHHGVTAPTVERELKAAGFDIVSSAEHGLRSSMVVARRPQP